MGYLDSHGLGTFWTKIKGKFAAGITDSTAASSYTINLQNGNGSVPTSQGSITINAASTGLAGVMSSADKTKLEGIDYNANAYTLPTATGSVLGGVKTGSNITNSSGTISLTKTNVTSALGYTPPTKDTNTTYTADGTAIQLTNTTFSHNTAAGYKHLPATGSAGYPLVYNSDGTASTNTIACNRVLSPNGAQTLDIEFDDIYTEFDRRYTKTEVDAAIASAISGTTAYGGTVSSETELIGKAYKTGMYFVVAGLDDTTTWAGYENGDMFFAKQDKSGSGSISDFDAVQSNITVIPDTEINALK